MTEKKRESQNIDYYHECIMSDQNKLFGFYEKTFKTFDKKTLWIFRAQKRKKNSDSNVPLLQTKLDKAFEAFKPHEKDVSGKSYSRRGLELAMVQEFERKATLYIEHPPEDNDILGWLALMQHYGAPTRLLDFTYSFFIAVFFAIAELDCRNEIAEIWAVDAKKFGYSVEGVSQFLAKKFKFDDSLDEKIKEINSRDIGKGFKEKLKDNAFVWHLMNNEETPPCLVYPVTPFKLNRRLTVQQGTFLVPGNINKSFEANIIEATHLFGLKKPKESVHRIVIDFKGNVKKRNDILRNLNSMNISDAALFPDLGGFAESLWAYLAYPEKLGIAAEGSKKRLKKTKV